jgi:hypothetical protein
MTPTPEQITAAARALADHNADVCNVNREDNWMLYGDSFRESAEIALRAAAGAIADAAAIAEREAFEADYAVVWNAAMIENGWNGGYTAEDVLALREGNEYGADRTYLNARWEGWQARAALATTGAPQHAVGADGLCADKMCSFAWIGPHGHNVPAAATEAPDKPNQT